MWDVIAGVYGYVHMVRCCHCYSVALTQIYLCVVELEDYRVCLIHFTDSAESLRVFEPCLSGMNVKLSGAHLENSVLIIANDSSVIPMPDKIIYYHDHQQSPVFIFYL